MQADDLKLPSFATNSRGSVTAIPRKIIHSKDFMSLMKAIRLAGVHTAEHGSVTTHWEEARRIFVQANPFYDGINVKTLQRKYKELLVARKKDLEDSSINPDGSEKSLTDEIDAIFYEQEMDKSNTKKRKISDDGLASKRGPTVDLLVSSNIENQESNHVDLEPTLNPEDLENLVVLNEKETHCIYSNDKNFDAIISRLHKTAMDIAEIRNISKHTEIDLLSIKNQVLHEIEKLKSLVSQQNDLLKVIIRENGWRA